MKVEKRLLEIFEKLKLDTDKVISNKNEKLLGKKIGLNARDLLILFFRIEEEFNIKIPESIITEVKFTTFKEMEEIIEEQL